MVEAQADADADAAVPAALLLGTGALAVLLAFFLRVLARGRTGWPATAPPSRKASPVGAAEAVGAVSKAASRPAPVPAATSKPAAAARAALAAPASPAAPAAPERRVDRIGGGDVRMWRDIAVQRLAARLVPEVETSPEGAALRRALRSRVSAYLDDRPRFVASGCADGQSRLLDARAAYKQLVSVRHDTGSRDMLRSVLLAPGPQLLTGTWDGKWHRWEAWPSKPLRATEFARGEQGVGHENLVSGLALSRDGRKLAVACSVGHVLLFQGDCPKKEVVITDRVDLVRLKEALKMGDYSEFFLKEDMELVGQHLEERDELLSEGAFEGKTSRRDLDKTELPAKFAFRFTGCLTRGHKKAWRILKHDGAVRCLVLSNEGSSEFLYSGSRDRSVRKWALQDGSLVHAYEGHASEVRCLAVNRDYLVSGGDDRTIKVWQKGSPSLLRSFAAHSDFVRAVALCQNLPRRLVSAGDDQAVTLWDAGTGARLLDFPHEAIVGSLLLDMSVLLTACDDGRLRVWRVEDAKLEQQIRHPAAVTALSWM